MYQAKSVEKEAKEEVVVVKKEKKAKKDKKEKVVAEESPKKEKKVSLGSCLLVDSPYTYIPPKNE